MGFRVLAAAGLAAVLVAGVAAIRAGAQAPSRGARQIVNLLDNPLTKFAELMPNVKHPRCQNCHGVTDPLKNVNHGKVGDEVTLTPDEIARVPLRLNAMAKGANFNEVCIGCHSDKAVAEDWRVPPSALSFVNKTAYEVCRIWKGSRSDEAEKLKEHFRKDPLALNAMDVGDKGGAGDGGRTETPPLNAAQFLAKAEEWLKGHKDIPCAGWEGTITQTEHVDLTTHRSTVTGQITSTVDEKQYADRTITITVESGDFRIAVQGTETRDATILVSDGRQSCTGIERMVRVYGTENGETLGKAQAATVEFRQGGAYTLRLKGPEEHTVRVEQTSGTFCAGLTAEPTSVTLSTKHDGWTVSIDGVLPNPADPSVLKGTITKTLTEADAWLTYAPNAVTRLQTRANGEDLPVPVTVTTTWDLQRKQ